MTHSNPRRNMIPQAVLMRSGIKAVNTAKPKDAHNAVKRNIFNIVKASECWVWMPKNRVMDHVSKNNNASVTLKRFDYIDERNNAQIDEDHFGSDGCTDSGEAGVQQRQKIMMKGRGFPEQKKDGSLFESPSKNVSNDEPQPSSNARKKDDEGVRKESGIDDQEGPKNSTQAVNTTGPSINIASRINVKNWCTKQENDKDYNEQDLLARIEAIRLFLAYASFMGFMVYQIDVKSAFLYGRIEEEVYVCQPPGFEDPNYPNKVYKVVKALYGSHQAPRAWYETLAKYLLDNGIHRGKIDKTLFIKRKKGDILLVQVYVDDIIFGPTKKELCTEFEKLMHEKF
ncbi:putative ribonuclease H-like domain-containing protein [Tanacetum coccineum]|uniref:Ribonuclease H-like domain-containing protein n=1 Tax=Tanacetum coccineum TaxID=301880 RepID=A0ABQ5I926_9ASTR